ncbi:hypothetical protein J2Y66_001055 [Paenarthrobacter nitroguajacolicus]|uniref:PHP domain-containing protein n=1 Tax=Paenarthrobacter nitroguajacolicus TaxID=211146 RepID=UPI0028561489|nr:PHP domain-containing protein [Paenarthrobacter nitroguajacolicus]MDR6986585.1 hypothetical protein [Paenarthrobacter nitroguajacolicus]
MCTAEENTTTHSRSVEMADAELKTMGLSRRRILQSAGILAAGTAASAAITQPAMANPGGNDPQLKWLVGDHHIHTQYSHDAKYMIKQQLDTAQSYGVDWVALTEHSNFGHANNGGAVNANKEILAQRAARPDLLIFQGLEWYIPGAEHASVLVAPGPNEVNLLRTFELVWDGKLNQWEKPMPGTAQVETFERKAVEAIAWLANQKRSGYIDDVVALANHPMRLGIDSPHELRAWRDAARDVMIGMEGAPGAQGSGVSQFSRAGDQRGEYTNNPTQYSFPGYPADAFRPYGGFDWATATVGGVWDSMLAEGLPFWITSNSDNHLTVKDTWKTGPYPAEEPYLSLPNEFDRWSVTGKRPDPFDAGEKQGGSDYWPGQFSRLHTGVTQHSYAGVLEAMRRGRMWVDHGHLLQGLDVRVREVRGNSAGNSNGRNGVTLGSRLQVRRGADVEISITMTTTDYRNFAGILPKPAHVDVIGGPVTGAAADRDTLKAPGTSVWKQMDVSGRTGTFTIKHIIKDVQQSCYFRLRGSDGNRHGAGYYGAAVDPAGPIRHGDNLGDADPWTDTWFYANPVFIDVA